MNPAVLRLMAMLAPAARRGVTRAAQAAPGVARGVAGPVGRAVNKGAIPMGPPGLGGMRALPPPDPLGLGQRISQVSGQIGRAATNPRNLALGAGAGVGMAGIGALRSGSDDPPMSDLEFMGQLQEQLPDNPMQMSPQQLASLLQLSPDELMKLIGESGWAGPLPGPWG